MRRWVRRGAIAAAVLALLVLGLVGAGLGLAEWRMQRQIDVAVHAVPVRHDDAALERGRYLYVSRGCVHCHGADGGGHTFLDDGRGLVVAGPNITPGGVVAAYRDEDWVRTIRHGVKPDGRPALVMPSEDYNRFTDEDLAALLAHLRQLPSLSGGAAVVSLPAPVRLAYGYGLMLDAASKIDHTLPPEQPVPESVSVEHGRYVANMCLGCHGPQLAGGRIPGAPPEWPPAARLIPGPGNTMEHYADAAAFADMMRTGKRPDGSPVQVMPFDSLAEMHDTDVQALFVYLKQLPGR